MVAFSARHSELLSSAQFSRYALFERTERTRRICAATRAAFFTSASIRKDIAPILYLKKINLIKYIMRPLNFM